MAGLNLFTNNAATTLASGISSSDTSLTVATSTGSLFPTISGSQYFYCTLTNTGGTIEIVKVTARSGDTMTVVRGQDGTSAVAWNAADKFELRLNRIDLLNFPQLDSTNTFAQDQTFSGKVNKYTFTSPATGATLTLADNSTLTTVGAYALTFTATNTTSLTLPTTGTLATLAGTETFTNKRITTRAFSTTSASSLTPDVSTYDQYSYTALAATLTIAAPTGTPTDGQKLIFRFKDNGTSQTLTWSSTWPIVIGVTLPTATSAGKTTYVGMIYNSTAAQWEVVAVTTQV